MTEIFYTIEFFSYIIPITPAHTHPHTHPAPSPSLSLSPSRFLPLASSHFAYPFNCPGNLSPHCIFYKKLYSPLPKLFLKVNMFELYVFIS